MKNKQIISKLEFAILLTFPILTTYNFISFKTNLEIAKINSYISVIYSSIIGLLLIYIYICILNYKPSLTLTEKNLKLFGKKIENIILFNHTINFIIIHYLKETTKILL